MDAWLQTVRDAISDKRRLSIGGHGSKSHLLGPAAQGNPLDTTEWQGIISYQPAELVITAKSGTALSELQSALAEQSQELAFDPPQFGGQGTVGGAVASGLSGPSRPWTGACRDAVLGVRIINGDAQDLTFGGQVMKNVAGYDVSRLQCGALGALGILTEVSLRVAPTPAADESFNKPMGAEEAIQTMRAWCRKPLPLAGLCYLEGKLWWRLRGHPGAVRSARSTLAGDAVENGFWQRLRDMEHAFFGAESLWRQFVPPSSPAGSDHAVIDWAGALRWATQRSASESAVASVAVGTPPALPAPQQQLASRIKMAFDPHEILNIGAHRADSAT